ncbi:MAG: phosphate acetyltransferase [Kiritimatiellae bacterium]|nr:phosphate acetyltransferase [Kiritimatiellia bacterium]MBP5786792.1 phosphate acetyltransferase [Kiritimatiellia bacterium]
MSRFINAIKAKAKADRKRIVLPETEDDRTIAAAASVLAEGVALPILLGEETAVRAAAARLGVSLEGAQIVDPAAQPADVDRYARLLATIRAKKGMTFEAARELVLGDRLHYGIMMVKAGDADGLVSGACHTSADMLRPALQVIKTAPGHKIASIAFAFEIPDSDFGEHGIILCADCALMQDPTPEELAEIGAESAASFEALVGVPAKVAFLCHSTKGSAKHPFVDKVQAAVRIAKERYPDVNLDGELQLDAALIPEIGASKAPGSPVAGHANVLIFPNLEAGNIGYKLIQRIGKAEAYSFLQGMALPVNDLSRGCDVAELAGVIAITAVQAQQKG